MHRLFLFLLVSGEFYSSANAQKKQNFNDQYLSDKTGDLILRLYGSNKYTRLTLGDYHYKERVVYKPNTNYNVGVGFNYRWLGINLGFKTPGINNDDAQKGVSKWLDLQAYVYLRKLTIDFYGQSFEGYYLANNDLLANRPVSAEYFLRNDIQTRNLGANFEYLFNGNKFSYRAVYLQNERQLKSAGSFLVGGGLHYHHTRADSSLIPANLKYADFGNQLNYNRSGIASITLNGGYAHTFVIAKGFFLTGSLMVGAGVNHTMLKNDQSNLVVNNYGLQLNGIGRLGAGYNGERMYAGVYLTTNLEASNFSNGGSYQTYETGMLRVAVGRRFNAPKRVVRLFDGIEGIFK